MSTSSPVRTRQPRRPSRPPQAGSNRFPRGESVVTAVRSVLLVVAAVSVIGTSNYFAYMIGRKQATYEELRRQVDRVVQLMDKKQVDDEPASAALKQRQDRLEQNQPNLSELTTSTINGKTTAVAPKPAPVERPAAPIDAAPVAPPDREVRLQPSEAPPSAVVKHPDVRKTAHQRGLRRPKVPSRGATEAHAEQPSQSTAAAPDAGVAGQ